MQDFRKLQIYIKSVDYCCKIYRFSTFLPRAEQYGLTAQLRRAASSNSLNISEGTGASTKKEFAQFISYSYRSINEVLTCLELIDRLQLLRAKQIIQELEDQGIVLSRMIYRFYCSLGGNAHT